MTIKAFVVIDDGDVYAETLDFDVKPEVGEILHWMAGGDSGHAKIVRLEHRQTPDGFCFTVIAEKIPSIDEWIASLEG